MIELRIIGLPAPQGSKSFKGLSKSGHAILTESSKRVKPWREAVVWAAREALLNGSQKIAGAVSVEMVFTLPRPKSARKGSVPCKKPDLSKLVRSTEDALTDAGAWEDDARVVDCLSRKVYPGQDGSLDVPGAVIRVSSFHGTAGGMF